MEGEARFALIGDNHGLHFSEEVIKVCAEKNIQFITLVSTHLCQSIKLAVFGPLGHCQINGVESDIRKAVINRVESNVRKGNPKSNTSLCF